MRHRVSGKKLGRNSSHRHALAKSMAVAFILSAEGSGRICTTTAKAKWLRPRIERLITLAKKSVGSEDSPLRMNCARRLFAELRDEKAVGLLMNTIAPRCSARSGGYTRIVKLAQVRLGDSGSQAVIEFVDK